jgi:hypothetical protein
MLTGALLGVTACGAFSTADVPIKRPPEILMTPAPALQHDPRTALSQAQVEILWGCDRSTGRIAMERHTALIGWVNETLKATGN